MLVNLKNIKQYAIPWIRLFSGPALFMVFSFWLPNQYAGPDGEQLYLSQAGRLTLSVMVWMAAWWLTEAVNISATALLPVVLFPMLGIRTMYEAASPYASPLIFLFMGGFLLALSMQRWGLDRRISLTVLNLVGTRPVNMVGGFMFVTALLSAFVSNTATTAMMLPIAISVMSLMERHYSEGHSSAVNETEKAHFALCMMLGIAYAASIGGVATIIGTPPNALLAGFLKESIQETFRMDIGYAQWLLIGIPMSAIFLPLGWVLLTRVIYPVPSTRLSKGQEIVQDEMHKLGKMRAGEWITFVIFSITAFCWITRPFLNQLQIHIGTASFMPFSGLTDAGIAMAGGVILFVIPLERNAKSFVMNWDTAKELPWEILILFGGGLSLASTISDTGVAEFIAAQTAGLGDFPDWLLVLTVSLMVVFLTELTSNTASTAALLPVLASLAVGMGIHPYYLLFPTALGASCAFMMPVATPPNAIVFGSNRISVLQMARAGIWFNLLSVLLVTLMALFWVPIITGINNPG